MRLTVRAVGGWLLACLAVAGCGDDPYWVDWVEEPDTVLLYSLARPELNLYSVFDFVNQEPLRIESSSSTGSWDLALDTGDGGLILSPTGVFGIESESAVSVLPETDFWSVVKAPRDTALYRMHESVPVEMGTVYVIRSRKVTDYYGSSCVYFGKVEPVLMDTLQQSLIFRYLVNPNCNSRELVPS